MPDATGFLIGQMLALIAGLMGILWSYRFRRSELRLRTSRGAWGWAIVDGVQIWILTAAVVAGLWLATRLSNGSHPLWFLLELIALLAGAFGARIAGSAIAPRVMRWLKA